MYPELTIQSQPQWRWKFNVLLQKGIKVKCRTNCSLMALLKENFDLDDRYIHQRIQTITLDGRPVDDPAKALVPDGATLAISGAMPGLVGAILRKGSYYAAMRHTISYPNGDPILSNARTGLITVKLFNLILKEQATAFLSRGIGVSGKALVELLDDVPALSPEQISPFIHDGREFQWPAWREHCMEQPLVFVTVRFL